MRENLLLLSGSIRLSLLERSLVGEIDGYLRLKRLLESEELMRARESQAGGLDLIIIDTPPTLGILTGNALAAVVLNSFIVSGTRVPEVAWWDDGMTKEQFEERNVFFQKEDRATYIERLLGKVERQ